MGASDDGRVDKPDLTDNKWAALEIELQEIKKGKWKAEAFDLENGEWTGVWPSSVSASQVAKKTGVTRKSVAQWRHDHNYLRGLFSLIARETNKRLEQGDAHNPEKRNADQARADTHVKIKNNWKGSERSIIDGKIYTDPDEYFLHIMDSGATLVSGELVLKKDDPDTDVT